MKNQEIKKIWVTPSVQVLNIKKDTFSGSKNDLEDKSASKNKKGLTGVSPGSTRNGR